MLATLYYRSVDGRMIDPISHLRGGVFCFNRPSFKVTL